MAYRQSTVVGFMYILIMRVVDILAMSTYSEQVHSFIFTNYTKDVRPNADKEGFTVFNQFGLLSINNFDEVSGTLTIICYVNQQWLDTRLSWNLSNYGNISYITVPQDKVWLPKLFLSNPSNELKALSNSDFKVTISCTGWIAWITGGVLKSLCTANVKYFPFDIQRCTLHLYNWGYAASEIYLNPDKEVDMSFFIENGEWSVKQVQLTTYQSESSLTLNVTMQRNSLRIIINVILPVTFLSVLNPIAFMLPAESGERMSFVVTIFLSYAIFMTLINQEMPKTSNPLPLLSVNMIVNLSFSAIIIILNVILLRLQARNDDSVPKIVARIFKPLTRKTKISDIVPVQLTSDTDVKPDENPDKTDNDSTKVKDRRCQIISWKDIINKCEFYCFIFCTTVAIALNVIFIVIMRVSSDTNS